MTSCDDGASSIEKVVHGEDKDKSGGVCWCKQPKESREYKKGASHMRNGIFEGFIFFFFSLFCDGREESECEFELIKTEFNASFSFFSTSLLNLCYFSSK